MKCKNCGQELADDMRFCTNCGSPIEEPQSLGEETMISTTDSIPNHTIMNCIGVISATWAEIAAKRSGLFEAIDAFRGNLGGDSYISYTEEKCYELAIKRIKEVAKNNGCNAIIGLRFISHFSEGVLRVTAYGTACIVN